MRKPIGQYMSQRLKRAKKKLGGWNHLARMIPASKSNTKSGHANPNWLGQLANDPTLNINVSTRRMLQACLRDVLKGDEKTVLGVPVEELRLTRPFHESLPRLPSTPAPDRKLTLLINGIPVEGDSSDLAAVLTKLTKQ